jgi:hypothetical protein
MLHFQTMNRMVSSGKWYFGNLQSFLKFHHHYRSLTNDVFSQKIFVMNTFKIKDVENNSNRSLFIIQTLNLKE